MKTHRFYTQELKLEHDFWVHQKELLHQWLNVLRFKAGQQVVLFDGRGHERLYDIKVAAREGVHLQHVTDFEPSLPSIDIYLFWSLLKKDKNEWVLQKATELGINHFVPLITERSDVREAGRNKQERWQKIIVEAAEQCGRSNIPSLREPMKLQTAFDDYTDIEFLVCQQGSSIEKMQLSNDKSYGLLIGPEGGWSDNEINIFHVNNTQHLALSEFTLRAETAAIVAAATVLQ